MPEAMSNKNTIPPKKNISAIVKYGLMMWTIFGAPNNSNAIGLKSHLQHNTINQTKLNTNNENDQFWLLSDDIALDLWLNNKEDISFFIKTLVWLKITPEQYKKHTSVFVDINNLFPHIFEKNSMQTCDLSYGLIKKNVWFQKQLIMRYFFEDIAAMIQHIEAWKIDMSVVHNRFHTDMYQDLQVGKKDIMHLWLVNILWLLSDPHAQILHQYYHDHSIKIMIWHTTIDLLTMNVLKNIISYAHTKNMAISTQTIPDIITKFNESLAIACARKPDEVYIVSSQWWQNKETIFDNDNLTQQIFEKTVWQKHMHVYSANWENNFNADMLIQKVQSHIAKYPDKKILIVLSSHGERWTSSFNANNPEIISPAQLQTLGDISPNILIELQRCYGEWLIRDPKAIVNTSWNYFSMMISNVALNKNLQNNTADHDQNGETSYFEWKFTSLIQDRRSILNVDIGKF